ncbi:MAG: VapC toxin family PIN domain ribonuclease [Betaproteobacteria bacterium]|nr:VapC toxin family PIN domain ribonuclease [Betaproteobacteria bacterium]
MAKPAAGTSRPSSAPHLLDANVLIALAWPNHVHHVVAHAWFEKAGHQSWATCPLTQLAFVRISSNPKIISTAVSPRAAVKALGEMIALAGHVFWADDLQVNNLASFTSNALVGHRQVTDAYLIELAKRRKGKVATLDAGLADLLPPAERARYVAFIGAE